MLGSSITNRFGIQEVYQTTTKTLDNRFGFNESMKTDYMNKHKRQPDIHNWRERRQKHKSIFLRAWPRHQHRGMTHAKA